MSKDEDELELRPLVPAKGVLRGLRELAPEERDAHLRLFLKLLGGTYAAFKVLAVLKVWLRVRRCVSMSSTVGYSLRV